MDYNPFSPEVQQNPFPYYAYLRHHAPVYQVPGAGFWVVSRYDDVLYILKNPQVFSSAALFTAMLGDLNPFPPEAPAIVGSDPPSHTRLRKLANRAFTPRRVASLESHLRKIMSQLIERIAERAEFNFVSEISAPLPIIVIAELLGVEPERQHDFKRWTSDLVAGFNQRAANGTGGRVGRDPPAGWDAGHGNVWLGQP